ncbi:hypothetical protein FB446DRAFT_820395 [Lentinula raphanica]|nr:hypothetical protein FB446DRAFT_820395 [Lentinula raphanica]
MTMMWFDDDGIPRPGKPGAAKKCKGKMWELEVFFKEYEEYADKYRFSKEERVRLVTRHMNWSTADFWKVQFRGYPERTWKELKEEAFECYLGKNWRRRVQRYKPDLPETQSPEVSECTTTDIVPLAQVPVPIPVPIPVIPVSNSETPAHVETLLDMPKFPPGLLISLMPTIEVDDSKFSSDSLLDSPDSMQVSEIKQELAFMDSTSSVTPSDMVDSVPQIQSVSVESELQSDSNRLDPSSFHRSHATFFDSKQNSDSTAVDELLEWILVYIDLTAFTYNSSALIPQWNWLIYLDAG